MKKLALLSLILSFSSLAFGKEAIVQPAIEEEVVQEIIVAPAPVVEAPVLKDHIYFRFGGNLWDRYSKYSLDFNDGFSSEKISNGKTKNFGYEFAIEGTRSITPEFELGLGVAYQVHNKNKSKSETETVILRAPAANTITSTMGRYNSVPVYVTGKYNFHTDSPWTPYLKANLGYSFNINEKDSTISDNTGTDTYKTKVKNGLYTGIGAGVEYNNFLVDIMYQTNFAKASLKDKENGETSKNKKFNYSAVTLSVGYKLDM